MGDSWPDLAYRIHLSDFKPDSRLIADLEAYHRQRRKEDPENVVAWDSDELKEKGK